MKWISMKWTSMKPISMKLISMKLNSFSRAAVWIVVGLPWLASCSNYHGFREAQLAEAAGDWDKAVVEYLDLAHRDPANLRVRADLLRAKVQASHLHFERAKQYREVKLLRPAMIELQQAVQLDPTNQYAQSELEKVRAEVAAAEAGEDHRRTLAEVKKQSEGSRPQPPILNPRSPEPIDLDFPEPVSMKKIYQALAKAFGINVLFDPNLRDQDMSIQLKAVNAQTALETVMRTGQHFYKVLDEHSIIIVADTPQNRRIYEDLIIQTFFLSNSDVKEVMTMLRSLVDSRKIAANEQLNAIILRDTVDKVKVAERIIQSNDKSKAEVVVDIELLQLNTSKLQDLGMSLSSYQVGVTLDAGGGTGDDQLPVRFNDLQSLNANNWLLTLPNFLFDFVKNSTEAQTLAKPQLRISEGEKARLVIGDRVPVPVTSFNTANTVGSNIVPLTSFQYQDVGITIEIEPRVHHNEEISLVLMVEVSNIAGNVGDQPIIGTRMIETTIRLKDGETNFLAGLIRSDETNSDQGVPGLSEIPLLGRLFSKKRSQNARTDIVLTLTPHIIRRADITPEDLLPIWVGTEQNVTFRGGSPRIESEAEGPFEVQEPTEGSDPAEEVRRRLQRLPRGLQPGQGEGEELPQGVGVPGVEGQQPQPDTEEPPPSGVDLVPGVRRNPLDRRRPPPELSRLDGLPVAPAGAAAGAPVSMFGQVAWASVVAWQPGEALRAVRAVAVSASEEEDPADSPDGPGPDPDPQDPTVRVQLFPLVKVVSAGQDFEVEVRATSQLPVAHLPVRLAYDPSRLDWLSVSSGGWLGTAGDGEVLGAEPRPGSVILGASMLGNAVGVSGSGTVMRVRFRAIAPGPATIALTRVNALASNLVDWPVAIEESESVWDVRSIAVTPTTERPRPAVAKAAS